MRTISIFALSSISLVLLLLTPAHATNCEDATQSDDLIRCARLDLNAAQAKFTAEARLLSSADGIDLKTRKSLAQYYKNAKQQLSLSCQSTYTDSRLRSMYVDSCTTEQIELLTRSQHRFRCSVQQDAQDCGAQ